VVPIVLEPLIASFCQAYPEVEVEIAASAELIDLATGGFDAGVRFGQFIAADMIAVRLTPPFRFIIVGSPAYLARSSQPESLEDLRQHACLRLRRSNGALALWSFNDNGRTIEIAVSGPLIASDFPTMLGAALEGIGLAQVPEPIAAAAVKAGKLVAVLEPFAPTTPGMFLYYPGRRQILPKLRAFIDHVKSRAGDANKVRIRTDDSRTLTP
jgi:DNA-binding transcriptional LysR family regulator